MRTPPDTLPDSPPDHRTRVAMERRRKMRQRLIESAFAVLARKGVHAAVIEDVIVEAGVSRGTFYNYFQNNEELLDAVTAKLGDYLMQLVDPVVRTQEDPAARVASGIRLCLRAALAFPQMAQLVSRMDWQQAAPGGQPHGYLARDVEAGLREGRFKVANARLATDLVVGPVISAFHALLHEPLPPGYPEDLAQGILLGLGLSRTEARQLSQRPLPDLSLVPVPRPA